MANAASAKSVVIERYQGEHGHAYHSRVHREDGFTQEIVSQQRARKLQPFIKPDDRVLEYGVGTGLNLRHVRCRQRVGFDLSDYGREICEQNGIEFVTSLEDAGGGFDVVVCHHTLEHVPDPLNCLQEMFEQLAEGGTLLLFVPFETMRMYRNYFPHEPNQHLFSWNALTLGNLVSSSGLQVHEARVIPFGYEQRLAPLARAGKLAYHLALQAVRMVRPADEVFCRAAKTAKAA